MHNFVKNRKQSGSISTRQAYSPVVSITSSSGKGVVMYENAPMSIYLPFKQGRTAWKKLLVFTSLWVERMT